VEHGVLVDALEEMAAIEDANMEKDATISELRQQLEQTIRDKNAERADALAAMQQFMDEDKYEASRVMQQKIDGQLGILLESITKADNKSAVGADETKSEVISFLRKSNNEKADSILDLQKLVADLEAEIKAGEQHQRDMFERGWTAARAELPKVPAAEVGQEKMLLEATVKEGKESQRQIVALNANATAAEERLKAAARELQTLTEDKRRLKLKLATAEETLAIALAREEELENALAAAVLTSRRVDS
jgi:hypothetical protein